MKIRVLLVSFAMAGAIVAGTALAQAPRPAAEKQWQQFLTKHPNAQAGLVNDPGYLAKHPGMAKWLHEHPTVSAYARRQGQIGGWDKKNQWHDRDWWTQNNPAWVRAHHPEWTDEAREHEGAEGEWDEHHHWRDRNWWIHNHPAWVHEHHPEWVEVEARQHHDEDGDWDEHHHWQDHHSWEAHHAEDEHHQPPRWHESEEHHDNHGHGEGHHDKD
jgi:hypothetical protein